MRGSIVSNTSEFERIADALERIADALENDETLPRSSITGTPGKQDDDLRKAKLG